MADTIPSEEEIQHLSEKGRAIYDEKLKAILEPEYNGQIVAIHLDTGDYEVAGNSSQARFALRRRYPSGLIITIDIGPARLDSLTLRILASGEKLQVRSYETSLAWNSHPRPTEILVLESDPLLGTALMRDYVLQIEMAEGGEVSLEPF